MPINQHFRPDLNCVQYRRNQIPIKPVLVSLYLTQAIDFLINQPHFAAQIADLPIHHDERHLCQDCLPLNATKRLTNDVPNQVDDIHQAAATRFEFVEIHFLLRHARQSVHILGIIARRQSGVNEPDNFPVLL